jgi:hypothetical protein
MRRFFTKNKTLFFSIIFLMLYGASVSFATVPANTLDPNCLPTDPACVVAISNGGTQDLQQVLDIGNTTTDPIETSDYIKASTLVLGNFYLDGYTTVKRHLHTPVSFQSNTTLPISVNGNYADTSGNISLSSITTAAGSTGQIQYNSSGVLAADADFSWDASAKVFGVAGSVLMKDTASSVITMGGASKSFISGLTDTGNSSYIDVGSTRDIVLGHAQTGGNINVGDSEVIIVGQALTGGIINSNNNDSFTMGTAATLGNLYGNANSITFGYVDSSASLYTNGGESLTFGSASGAGSNLYSGTNALTFGTAYGGGQLHSDGDGSLVFGTATNGGSIFSAGSGSFVFGSATDTGSSIIASQFGQAFGAVSGGASINANNIGSFAFGNALTGSSIVSQGNNALAFGFGQNSGVISAEQSSLVFGEVDGANSILQSAGEASLVFGQTSGGGLISAQGSNSLIFGSVDATGSYISTTANNSFAFGKVVGDGTGANYITVGNSLGEGSLVFGYTSANVHSGNIETDGRGAFAGGYVQTGAIVAIGNGSFTFGDNIVAQDVNQYIFGQNGSIGSGATDSFLIALGGATSTGGGGAHSFVVGYNGKQNLAIDATNGNIDFLVTAMSGFAITDSGGTNCSLMISGSFSCSSDIRLKHNINQLDQSSLTKILALNPVTFNYNWQKDGEAAIPGFIAQDFEQVFPDMVSIDRKTGYKSLSYAPLMPYVVKAIQEMNIKIDGITPEDLDASAYTKIKEFLRGIAKNSEALVDRVRTHELCVDDVCVTRDQFKKMIDESAGAAGATASAAPAEAPVQAAPVSDTTPNTVPVENPQN